MQVYLVIETTWPAGEPFTDVAGVYSTLDRAKIAIETGYVAQSVTWDACEGDTDRGETGLWIPYVSDIEEDRYVIVSRQLDTHLRTNTPILPAQAHD